MFASFSSSPSKAIPSKVIPSSHASLAGSKNNAQSFAHDASFEMDMKNARIPPPVPKTRPTSVQRILSEAPKPKPIIPHRSYEKLRPPSTNNVELQELLQVSNKIRIDSTSKRASLAENFVTLQGEQITPLSHLAPPPGLDCALPPPPPPPGMELEEKVDAPPSPPRLPPVRRSMCASLPSGPPPMPSLLSSSFSVPSVAPSLTEQREVEIAPMVVETCVESTPAVAEDVVVVEAPVTLVETPVPLMETPVPLVEAPVSLVETPVSLVETPVSLVETPVSLVETPVSLVETPVPLVEIPVPLVETPGPLVEETICKDLPTSGRSAPAPKLPDAPATMDNNSNNSGRRQPPPVPTERPNRSSSVPTTSTAASTSKPRSTSVPSIPTVARHIKQPRKPLPPGAAMFDVLTGKRRSSTTVAQVALFLMQDDALFTIPRDDVTDALNWTAVEDEENIFSCENAEGLEFGKIHEKFAQKQRNSITSRNSFSQTKAVLDKNHKHAVTITKMFRGWFVRVKMRSFHWVRARIQLAIRSRNSLKVQDALNCSYELGKRFIRPEREHQLALHTLDTIREEQSVRKKLTELAALDSKFSRSGEEKIVKKYASVAERVTRCQSIDPHAFLDEVSVKAMACFRVFQNRMRLRQSLARAIETNSKAELLAAVKEFEMEHFGCWQQTPSAAAPEGSSNSTEDDFKEHRVARDLLVRIQHEEPVLRDLLAASCCADELELLEEQIARAVRELSFQPSAFALQTLEMCNAVLDLRRAMHRSKRSKLWIMREKQVNEVKLRLRPVWDKNQDFQPFIVLLAEEMDAMSAELDNQVGVSDLLESLKDSLQRCDVDDLRNVLKKSEKAGLFDRTADVGMQALISEAQAMVRECEPVHDKLAAVLAGCNRNPVVLQQCVDEVQAAVRPGSTDALLVQECLRLIALARDELEPLVTRAWDEVPDRTVLEQIVHRVRTQERLGGMECLQGVDDLLALDDTKLCQEQLRAATRLGNAERKIHLTMRYRSLHLEQHGHMFRLDRFPDLREAKEWFDIKKPSLLLAAAAAATTHRSSVSTSRMLSWSRTAISTPLTRTCARDPRLKRLAVSANRTILAYCGDLVEMDLKVEFGGDLCLALHELLLFALKREEALRDELFVQCLKHLTDNPRCNSRTRAWNVLAFLLITFPPSTTLDLFLEYFIRNNAPLADLESLLQKLHQSNFGGERAQAPTLQEIRMRQNDGGSVEGL